MVVSGARLGEGPALEHVWRAAVHTRSRESGRRRRRRGHEGGGAGLLVLLQMELVWDVGGELERVARGLGQTSFLLLMSNLAFGVVVLVAVVHVAMVRS